ncbi:MAG: UDP-N-acetylmuramoyl-L-alanine--D-glutamate ligase [Bacillota bacterium]
MYEVKNKKITIIGLSKRTGVATAKKLCEKGAQVIVSDIKSRNELKEQINLLKKYDIEYDLNGHSEKSLKSNLIVVSPGVPLDLPFFKKAKKKKIPVISEVELAYRLTKAKIIGITGTNGKTTTTSLTGKILKNADIEGKVVIGGNIGTPLIQVITDLSSSDWVVAELSSFQLESIKEFKPKISVYLNFAPDHLDRHHDLQNYFEAKKNIFKNQTQKDYAIINQDDEKVIDAAKYCKAHKYKISLKYKVNQGAFVKNNNIFVKIEDNLEKIISVSDIPIKGKHNIMNVAFGCMISKLVGVNNNIIKNTIKNYSLKEHRLQVLEYENNFEIIDDSKATNPDAAKKALESINKPIILIAGGQDRGADFSNLAETIKDKVKTLILLGETSEKLKKEVLEIEYDKKIFQVNNMEEAVKKAFDNIKSDEVLLLSPGCPSWDMYSSYKQRGKKFQQEVEKNLHL